MKIKRWLTCFLLIITGCLHSASSAGMPAPLPEFKTSEQFRQQLPVSQIASRSSDFNAAVFLFYTGKTVDNNIGVYLFSFRSYDPVITSWTTCDLSGFPDGPNNYVYVNDPISFIDPDGLSGKKVIYIYAYTGDLNYDTPSAEVIASMVTAHMNNFRTADGNDPDLQYVSDGDYITYGSISSPSQLNSFSMYDQIYVAAHGLYSNNEFTGYVRIGGNNYLPSQVTASNLKFFDYCGANGSTINADEISSKWFFQGTEPYLLE